MGPYIGPSLAASLADETELDIGKPDVVSPLIGRHCDRVAALVVSALDQDSDDAGGSHLAQPNVIFTGRGS